MLRLSLVVSLLLGILAPVAIAQTAGPGGGDALTPEELPPDWRAYTAAARIPDPAKRVRELEAVAEAYPDTPGMLASRQAILETTAEHWPEREDEILQLARRFVAAAPPNARIFAADAAAQALIDSGVLLSEAEKLARSVLGDLGGTETEDPEELARRAPYVATLGRALARQGRLEEAEPLLKLAWAANPRVIAAPLALADIAEARGDDEEALGHLIAARLTGREPGKTARRLEALYRRLNGGTLDGLDRRLDREYQRRFPNPIDATRWIPAEGGTGRTLLLEVFTGTGCAPCVAMDLSVEAAMRRYGWGNLSVISYHRHIPVVDPFSNIVAESRASEYDLITIPALSVDGRVIRGGGARDDAARYWSYLSQALEERLAVPPQAELNLDVRREGEKIAVVARARLLRKGDRKLRLGLALVEGVSYSGETGIRFHPAVERDLILDDLSPDLAPVRHVFDLAAVTARLVEERQSLEAQGITYPNTRDVIEPDRVRVVGFVQDPETRMVLQSVAVRPRTGDVGDTDRSNDVSSPER